MKALGWLFLIVGGFFALKEEGYVGLLCFGVAVAGGIMIVAG